MKQWFWFEANGQYLGKVYTTKAAIVRQFHATIFPNRLVIVYRVRYRSAPPRTADAPLCLQQAIGKQSKAITSTA